ncbi:MAG: glycogen debranching enzyme GlgX, partial [Candidatus Omnitrophica bacterium]|nr:glycogen debranching enzyme GlgX [Candidatus Omnitrophota bacterium]
MVKVDRLENNTTKKVLIGKNNPLGSTLTEKGVNFAIFSQYAEEVFLFLFDDPYSESTDTIKLKYQKDNVWHCFVSGIKSGQIYGYKINGDYDPAKGLRFNKNKLLIDPYTKALTGKSINEDNLLLGYDAKAYDKDLVIDCRDNTKFVSKSIVVDDSFDWQNDVLPKIPSEKLIIYETHVKGFTAHPSSGVKNKGTYLGFIEKIPYLKMLGINAVEFLP